MTLHLTFADEIVNALDFRRPVVALETSYIAQGLPNPANLETARAVEAAVRAQGAIPAHIALWQGAPTIGLTDVQLQTLARRDDIHKASRRDIGIVVAQKRTAATTVAATMYLAQHAGIRVLATGGIGGAHRDIGQPWDISADLFELARVPVAVVCSGAKSILDIPRTLEILESYSVPVIGYGTDTFPAFYLRSSGQPVTARIDSAKEAAVLLATHWQADGAGIVIAQPIAADAALEEHLFQETLEQAEWDAAEAGIRGTALTPFLLGSLAEKTQGKALHANKTLLVANARLAAQIATALSNQGKSFHG